MWLANKDSWHKASPWAGQELWNSIHWNLSQDPTGCGRCLLHTGKGDTPVPNEKAQQQWWWHSRLYGVALCGDVIRPFDNSAIRKEPLSSCTDALVLTSLEEMCPCCSLHLIEAPASCFPDSVDEHSHLTWDLLRITTSSLGCPTREICLLLPSSFLSWVLFLRNKHTSASRVCPLKSNLHSWYREPNYRHSILLTHFLKL